MVKGSKRKYTDNVAVAHLKRMLNAGKEWQASLINYRRGGIPFINLVTVVPVPWDGTDIVYHVGFQVDLVEQPNAILRNMRDGSYQVNYTVANPPQPPLRPAGRDGGTAGLGQEQLDILGARVNQPGFGQGEDGPKMEWLKMVLENADGQSHLDHSRNSFSRVNRFHPRTVSQRLLSIRITICPEGTRVRPRRPNQQEYFRYLSPIRHCSSHARIEGLYPCSIGRSSSTEGQSRLPDKEEVVRLRLD